jgi:pimeloyl-ACP methyl ester carboxylesterase
MADFVLIHGSAQSARCWDRVRDALAARGHHVATPELPKKAEDWTLARYAQEIAADVPDLGSVPAVVVAHSFTGVFLPLIAALRPSCTVVFLAAVVPEPGKSVRDQYAEDPGMFHREWIAAGPRWFQATETEGLAREFLFHDCDEETLPWALDTLELFDTRHLVTEPSPVASWPKVRTASIVASGDRTLTADWCTRTTERVLGIAPIPIDAGHCPHVSRPREVAEILGRLSAPA